MKAAAFRPEARPAPLFEAAVKAAPIDPPILAPIIIAPIIEAEGINQVQAAQGPMIAPAQVVPAAPVGEAEAPVAEPAAPLLEAAVKAALIAPPILAPVIEAEGINQVQAEQMPMMVPAAPVGAAEALFWNRQCWLYFEAVLEHSTVKILATFVMGTRLRTHEM